MSWNLRGTFWKGKVPPQKQRGKELARIWNLGTFISSYAHTHAHARMRICGKVALKVPRFQVRHKPIAGKLLRVEPLARKGSTKVPRRFQPGRGEQMIANRDGEYGKPGSVWAAYMCGQELRADFARVALQEMPPERLLAEAVAVGVEASANGDRIRIRGPQRSQELSRFLISRKAELLPLLQLVPRSVETEATPAPEPGTAPSEAVPSPPAAEGTWDPARADAELARVAALIDHQAAKCRGLDDVQRRILSRDYRAVAQKYHRESNLMLFDLADDVLHQIRVIWELSPAQEPGEKHP